MTQRLTPSLMLMATDILMYWQAVISPIRRQISIIVKMLPRSWSFILNRVNVWNAPGADWGGHEYCWANFYACNA